MRRQQLLAQLLENGRSSRWLSISLGLGLHARSRLVEYQWSWERWGISLELHGRTWPMTWREMGPQSQRLPLEYTTPSWIKILQRAQGPPAQASTCPGPSEVYQRPSGWSRGGMGEGHVVRWDQNFTFRRKKDEYNPKNTSQPWSMGVETSCFGGAFLQRGPDNCTVLRGGWMGPCIARFWLTTSFPQ